MLNLRRAIGRSIAWFTRAAGPTLQEEARSVVQIGSFLCGNEQLARELASRHFPELASFLNAEAPHREAQELHRAEQPDARPTG
jgi:hypothetical protein